MDFFSVSSISVLNMLILSFTFLNTFVITLIMLSSNNFINCVISGSILLIDFSHLYELYYSASLHA